MPPLAIVSGRTCGVVVTVVGQLTDYLELPIGSEFTRQTHPEPAEFLEVVVEGLAGGVLAVDMSDLMLVRQKQLGALQSCSIWVVEKIAEVPELGVRFVVQLRER